jgi:tetratricopeptide (TPR) repeat protein
MRSHGSRRSILFSLCALPLGASAAWAQATPAAEEHAGALLDAGDAAGALAALEQILARTPNDPNALLYSARALLLLGRLPEARARAEKVITEVGSFFVAWETLIQITQAQGDKARRDEAIEELKLSVSTAVDQSIRAKGSYVREYLPVGKDALVVWHYFTRSGTDFVRYEIAWRDPDRSGDSKLVLKTDEETTEQWSETALLPPDAALFHLDLVDTPRPGETKTSIYAYFVGEPDYDTFRARAMQVLHGELKPQSGTPGGLDGVMKP